MSYSNYIKNEACASKKDYRISHTVTCSILLLLTFSLFLFCFFACNNDAINKKIAVTVDKVVNYENTVTGKYLVKIDATIQNFTDSNFNDVYFEIDLFDIFNNYLDTATHHVEVEKKKTVKSVVEMDCNAQVAYFSVTKIDAACK